MIIQPLQPLRDFNLENYHLLEQGKGNCLRTASMEIRARVLSVIVIILAYSEVNIC